MIDPASFVLNRFGMGGRPDERSKIARDPFGWVMDGLVSSPDISLLQNLPHSTENFQQFRALQLLRQDFFGGLGSQEQVDQANSVYIGSLTRQNIAHFGQSIASVNPVKERLAQFWANHFTVSALNDRAHPGVSSFRRETIYPNLSGTFADMLQAVETHPTMLIYLDNYLSIGPNSAFGLQTGGDLNENLAREILELHTLGADGGYGQSDVRSFARILTGWSIGGPDEANTPDETVFFDIAHEPGTHTVLGKRYGADGKNQLLSALSDFAVHPSTAIFIATKLARHFIADIPPPDAVAQIAKTFKNTGGDLPSVHRTTFEVAMLYSKPQAKARTPYDYIVAMGRALNLDAAIEGTFDGLYSTLYELGNVPGFSPDPDGWADDNASWVTPQGIIRRVNIAQAVSDVVRSVDALRLIKSLYGRTLGESTRQQIEDADSPEQSLAIALASPEMNYR